jgi:adenine deaminase
MISVHIEDGMVPPHDWDKLVLASGVTLIDAENIKGILGGAK